MKILLYILLYQILATGERNILNYESIPLDWSQFKKVNYISNGAAAQIAINQNFSIENKNNTLVVISSIKVDPNLSKVNQAILKNNTSVQNKILLEHEKGHLAISLYYHYALIDSLNNAKHISKTNYKKEVRNIIQYFDQYKNQRNYEYDLKTNHHINQEEQKIWDKNILTELSKYLTDNKSIEWTIQFSKQL